MADALPDQQLALVVGPRRSEDLRALALCATRTAASPLRPPAAGARSTLWPLLEAGDAFQPVERGQECNWQRL